MIRNMTETETKYVKIINKNNQVNIIPMISRFTTVQRFLTAREIRACLNKGALVSAIKADGTFTPLNMENYDSIEEVDAEEVELNSAPEVVEEATTEETLTDDPDDQPDPYDADDYGSVFE